MLFWGTTQRRMVILYHLTLRNTPEEQGSHQHRGRNPSRMVLSSVLVLGSSGLGNVYVISNIRS
jgi:hypothetical protein